MIIRKATTEDIGPIISLGLEFGIESQPVHTMSVSPGCISRVVHLALEDPNSVLLVLEIDNVIQGLIYGMVLSPFFSNELVLQELAFYSRKRKRGILLLDAFEREAKRLGVKKIVMGCKPKYCDLRRLYEYKGYKLLENQYLKVEV